jgi:hypothetical protein
VRDELAALRREHEELTCLAAEERRDGYHAWADQREDDARRVAARIDELEAKQEVNA